MTYIRHKISQEVLDEIEHITDTLPGKVYYSDDGEALILADEGKYIISVEPPSVILEGFNNGNPTTHSAYLVTQPAVDIRDMVSAHHEPDAQDMRDEDLAELEGWTTGWEC